MFNIGDLIIYSAHGICRIDDICEKTYSRVTKNYYVLHPIQDCRLKISIPVDSDKVNMLDLINKEEAEEIIESFKLPGTGSIELHNERNQIYSDILKKGNRKEISNIVNTLIQKKLKTEESGKKFHEKDNKLLMYTQNILFTELAMALNTTFEKINDRVIGLIKENWQLYKL